MRNKRSYRVRSRERIAPTLGMTAMLDVALVMVMFFVLVWKPVIHKKVQVNLPEAHAKGGCGHGTLMMITVTESGKVFAGFNNYLNQEVLYLTFTEKYPHVIPAERQKSAYKYFALQESIGVPLSHWGDWLGSEYPEAYDQPGLDSQIRNDGTKNELQEWIRIARYIDPEIRFAIKGDEDAPYNSIHNVFASLQSWNINKMHLITNREVYETI